MSIRMFDVTVRGYPPHPISARSRGKALYQCFLLLGECWPDLKFGAFLKIATARSRATPPADDGYDYIRRNYSVDPKIGHRVRLKDEGPSTGLEGEIIYPGPSTAHVHVVIDGRAHAVLVHPLSVVLL